MLYILNILLMVLYVVALALCFVALCGMIYETLKLCIKRKKFLEKETEPKEGES